MLDAYGAPFEPLDGWKTPEWRRKATSNGEKLAKRRFTSKTSLSLSLSRAIGMVVEQSKRDFWSKKNNPNFERICVQLVTSTNKHSHGHGRNISKHTNVYEQHSLSYTKVKWIKLKYFQNINVLYGPKRFILSACVSICVCVLAGYIANESKSNKMKIDLAENGHPVYEILCA